MATDPVQEETIARLRALAAGAGVALDADDLARIGGGAYLRNADAFAQLVAGIPLDTIPDSLKEWTPPSAPPVAPGDAREGGR